MAAGSHPDDGKATKTGDIPIDPEAEPIDVFFAPTIKVKEDIINGYDEDEGPYGSINQCCMNHL